MSEFVNFIKDNYIAFFLGATAIWPLLELIVRLTPTESDNTVLEKIGQAGRKIMDRLGIPNVQKEKKDDKASE